MRNLLRCRRGSLAFATVLVAVPMIGVVALGAETGSWYVIKQHAQNAADAAALSGGLRLACTLAGSCADTQTSEYRGKQFAAQNAFCNAGDTAYPGSRCTTPPAGTTQTVTIDRGTFGAGAWASSSSGTFVRATVTQTQPGYLANVLGLSTVSIGAQAVAQVQNPQPVCGLGLGRTSAPIALTLGGSANLSGSGCGLMSDTAVKYASTPTFTGSGWAVYAANGCTNSGNCNPGVPYNYYSPPATNPLQKLDTESFNSTTGNTKTCGGNVGKGQSCSLTANSTGAYGDLRVTNGGTVTLASGTYFFYNATISITGGTVTGTNVNIVLLGDSSLSISGGTVSLSANFSNTTYPDLNGVLIDDQAPNKSNNAVTINGGGTVSLGGVTYFPNVDVTWSGTTSSAQTTCTEVIANTITMDGNAYLNSQGCAAGSVPEAQVVVLVL